MIFIDLVMENGELVRIEVPDEHEYECWDAIENSMKTRGFFSPGRWEGCQASYLGMTLGRVNMGKVVAML
jgi:hypothetical protein